MSNPPNGPVKWGKILQDVLLYIFSVLDYIPEKNKQRGVEKIPFQKKTLDILVFLLYPWKFQTKQSFTSLGTPQNCAKA